MVEGPYIFQPKYFSKTFLVWHQIIWALWVQQRLCLVFHHLYWAEHETRHKFINYVATVEEQVELLLT